MPQTHMSPKISWIEKKYDISVILEEGLLPKLISAIAMKGNGG